MPPFSSHLAVAECYCDRCQLLHANSEVQERQIKYGGFRNMKIQPTRYMEGNSNFQRDYTNNQHRSYFLVLQDRSH